LQGSAGEHGIDLLAGQPTRRFELSRSCSSSLTIANLDADARASRWKLIPQGTDVLITHGPPQGVFDGGTGCKHLMDAVQDIKPSIHCFGHFHNCGGKSAENRQYMLPERSKVPARLRHPSLG
jgi:hypothetical protein